MGTIIYDAETNEQLFDLDRHGEKVALAQARKAPRMEPIPPIMMTTNIRIKMFGYIKLSPHMFWPAVLVATAGNTVGGINRRIVFFDTLLNRLNAGEIEAVLAHELGAYGAGELRLVTMATLSPPENRSRLFGRQRGGRAGCRAGRLDVVSNLARNGV